MRPLGLRRHRGRESALRSEADRERARAFFHENLVNLLEPDGRLWNLFTPWHADDLNSHLSATANTHCSAAAIGATSTPIWPEKWPRERLDTPPGDRGIAFAGRIGSCASG